MPNWDKPVPDAIIVAVPEITEVELKFVIVDQVGLRTRLFDMGAESTGRVEENNLRFDGPDFSLSQRGIVLRLRWTDALPDSAGILTLKQPLPDSDPAFKMVREIEMNVDDRDAALALLQALGYHLNWRYEKRRETLHLDGLEICLDDTPLGFFMELEGQPAQIESLAARLDLDIVNGLTQGYGELFDLARTGLHLDVQHMTFEEFEGITIDPAFWQAGR